MCEVESSGTIGNGMASSPVIKLNVSCPEEMTLGKRESLHSVDSTEADIKVKLESNEEKVSQEGGELGKLPSGDSKDREELPSSGGLNDQEEPPPSGDLKDQEKSPPSEDLKDRRGSDGTREPLGVTPRISQDTIVDGSLEVGGVDPFKPSGVRDEETNGLLLPPKDPSDTAPSSDTGRRDSKSVSFKEPENEDDPSAMNDVRLSNSRTSSISNGSKEDDEAVEKRRSSGKSRALGENNPVYRLSMKLSPNLFNVQEIPGANQHREADKAGYLTKLSGRSFPYIAQWKRRYCVLAKGRLYYYEREDSKPGEKSNGVINLEYFDQVTEAAPKDCKKATNVFVITSQDRSFFDPGRHLFSADTLPDMKDWVRKLQSALEQIRNNTRPAATSTLPSSKKEGGKKGKEQGTENKENKENSAQGSAKERKKKKDSHRPRKSARVGDGPETQDTSSTQMTSRREAEQLPMMTSSVIGIQLPGMTSQMGVPLPGLSPTKKEPVMRETKEAVTMMTTTTTTTSDSNAQSDEGLPAAGPTLTCVTKQRNKGPQGRRAPQNRRTLAAASLKKRASSLSALEYQEVNDNRSESSQGTRDSDRHSKTTENDLEVVEENPALNESFFEDIDKDLFFSKRDTTQGKEGENGTKSKKEKEGVKDGGEALGKTKESGNTENSREKERVPMRSRSRNSTLFGTKLSRFRETMMTMKRSRFESKEVMSSSHPDEVIGGSRWSCNIL